MNNNIKAKLEKELSDLKKNNYDVILGMSGGVDSTYSLLSFLKQGKKVLGIYLNLFDDKKNSSMESARKAKKLADKFNIDFKVIEAKEYFKEKVQTYFVRSYLDGKTPNPCSICNRDVKIAILYEISEILNVKNIATGHYAGIENFKNNLVVKKGKEPKKEQSYFLALIDKTFLTKLIFPLSEVENKEEIRSIIVDNGIMNLESTSDSQDICFLQNDKYEEFIEEFDKKIQKENVEIYLPNGKITNGKHIFNYTIGQRKGLGIAYNEPLFVKDIIKEENKKDKIILDIKENMYENYLYISDINLFIPKKEMPENVKVKLRYSKTEINAKINFLEKNMAKIIFLEKQIKGARGQICAIYYEDFLLGGGIIN